jgi:hypothetical protein
MMKELLLEMSKYVLGPKNIAKILLVPEFPVNFNPSKASLNL